MEREDEGWFETATPPTSKSQYGGRLCSDLAGKKNPIFGLDWAKTIVSPILRQAFISIGMEGLIF